jgi:hypothetical protein
MVKFGKEAFDQMAHPAHKAQDEKCSGLVQLVRVAKSEEIFAIYH